MVADTQKYIVPKEKGAESTDNSTEQDEAQQVFTLLPEKLQQYY